MIGRVRWDEGGGRTAATLGDDGRWAVVSDGPGWVAAESCRRFLEVHYADAYGGPADGPFGVAILRDLARHKGGKVELEPKRRPPPGTVY